MFQHLNSWAYKFPWAKCIINVDGKGTWCIVKFVQKLKEEGGFLSPSFIHYMETFTKKKQIGFHA